MAKRGEGKHTETGDHHAAFERWYENDRHTPEVAKEFRVTERTVREWAARFDWNTRADRRDREAADRADRDAIRRRAAMLIKCRQAGELMVSRGIERLAKHPLESDQVAISAIKTGSDVWRTAEGLPAWAVEIMEAGPEELERLERDLDNRRSAALGSGEEAAVTLNGHG